MVKASQTIPVTVIGGYLGAGKTTLVNHLLRNANGRKLAVLVNEFGELPIDEDLIEAEDDNLISLAGGCICCSYGNDLVAAMIELSEGEAPLDHVIIESSGVAIPSSIAGSVSLLSGYTMDGIVILVDANSVMDKATDTYLADTILRQLSDCNIVLLNKADMVSDKQLETLQGWASDNAQNATIISTTNGAVPVEVILQSHPENVVQYNVLQAQHLEGFESKMIVPDGAMDLHQFGEALIADNPSLVRAKGFAMDLDDTLKTIQIVGKNLDISPAPRGTKSGIVLIFHKNNPCS